MIDKYGQYIAAFRRPDNIKGIRGKDALDVVRRLNSIDKADAEKQYLKNRGIK
jgi:hypothetical protein